MTAYFTSPILPFLIATAIATQNQSGIRVNLTSGTIEGFILTAPTGAEGRVFLGIPYAQPPLGQLRFRNPAPASKWRGILPCKEYQSNCWQMHWTRYGEYYNGTEDCLYLNVFAGVDCVNCPVLYYIHGGKYESDTPAAFPPALLVDNFASHGLIVITVAYRLNAFGFWSTGGEEAIGNYGMHDMIAGLQWVQREIHNFGGDRNKVTIMGHSSGGMAVSLLTLSPRTIGLFHQAIMMSGNTVDETGMHNDLTLYSRLAIAAGCVESEEEWRLAYVRKRWSIVQCMREVDADTVGRLYLELGEAMGVQTRPRNDGPNGLFPKPISQLLSDRRPYPALTGTAKREAPLPFFTNATSDTVLSLCYDQMADAGLTNKDLTTAACNRQFVRPLLNHSESNDQCNTSSWASQAERLVSAPFHSRCYKESDSLRRKGANVYLYSFDYEKSGLECATPYHAFDLTYLIGEHIFPFDERDEKIRAIYAGLFANFIKYGDPTPNSEGFEKWSPLKGPFGFNYYSVDLPAPRMRDGYHMDDIIFWNYMVPSLQNQQRKRTAFTEIGENPLRNESATGWPVWMGVAIGAVALYVTILMIARSACHKKRKPVKERLLNSEGFESRYQTFSE